jgi:hypothetical protein
MLFEAEDRSRRLDAQNAELREELRQVRMVLTEAKEVYGDSAALLSGAKGGHALRQLDDANRTIAQRDRHILELNQQLKEVVQQRADMDGTAPEPESVLRSLLAITRQQLKCALEELEASRYRLDRHREADTQVPNRSAGMQESERRTAAEEQELRDIRMLFRVYDVEFTVAAVHRLFDKIDSGQGRTTPKHSRQGHQAVDERADPAAINGDLRQDDDFDVRNNLFRLHEELSCAQKQIEELTFALELEKRTAATLAQHVGMRDPSGTIHPLHTGAAVHEEYRSEAAQRAAREIAFLCDTLAATRAEADALKAEVQSTRLERDAALESFRDLKERSEDILQSCHELSSTVEARAEKSIEEAVAMVRKRDREVIALRGQLATQHKSNEELRALKADVEKDLLDARAKCLGLTELVAKQRADLQRAKQRQRDGRRQNSCSPRVAGPASLEENVQSNVICEVRSPSADTSRGDPLSTSSPKPPEDRRSKRGGSPATAPRHLATPSRRCQRRPSPTTSSSESAVFAQLREEHEELRRCLDALTPFAPSATCAREVSSAVAEAMEALQGRVKSLESLLKKTTTQHELCKRRLAETTEQCAAVDKLTRQVATLEKQLEMKERVLSQAKRSASSAKKQWEEDKTQMDARLQNLTCDVQCRDRRIQELELELHEGKSMLQQLIDSSSKGAMSSSSPSPSRPGA